MFNKERKTKYAIRKLAVATVSLAIGSVVAVPAIVDSGQVAHAEEQGGVTSDEEYRSFYQFVSGTEGRTLPPEIEKLKPANLYKSNIRALKYIVANQPIQMHVLFAQNPLLLEQLLSFQSQVIRLQLLTYVLHILFFFLY